MLDKLRQQSRSFIIWFLFGIIILSFVVTFGPASMRLTCGGATRAGEVAGRDISNADLQFALRLAMVRNAPPTYRLTVYDQLLRRELLAMEGKQLGLKVTEDEIVQMITKRRRILVLGMTVDLANTGAWPTRRNKEGKVVPAPDYYHERFKKWVNWQLGMKIKEFMAQQEKELLAKAAENTIKNGVIVSEREARAVFEYQNHSLKLSFARISIDRFKKGILVPRAEVMRWLSEKENRDRVDQRYKKIKWKLTGLPLERRVRHILVKVGPNADAAEKQRAKQRLVKLRASLVQTPTDFAAMAQMLSEDEETKASGGDLGWKEPDKLGQGEAFAKAVKKLEVRKVSEVIESEKGYHLAIVEGQRKGDVPLAKARVWIAEQMILQRKAEAAARKVAEEALRRLSMGQTMEQVFPPAEAPSEDNDDTGAKDDADGSKKDDADGQDGQEGGDSAKGSDKQKPGRWHPLLPTPQEVTVLRTDSTIGQIGKVKGLVSKVWKLTEESPVLEEIVKIPGSGTSLGSLVLIRLQSKTEPSEADFESQKDEIIRELLTIKRDDAVKRWVYQRCQALRADNKIQFRDNLSKVEIRQGKGEQEKKTVVKYVPCQRLQRFGRAAPGLQFR